MQPIHVVMVVKTFWPVDPGDGPTCHSGSIPGNLLPCLFITWQFGSKGHCTPDKFVL